MEKNEEDQFSKIAENLGEKLTLESTSNHFERGDDDEDDDDHDVVYIINDDDDDDDDNDDKEFEFSFAGVEVKSPESAEVLFQNGRIRPTYPFIVENSEESSSEKPVNKVFVAPPSPSSAATAAMSPEFRRKSNSTGFSRFWRVKELLARSNSDGKDRFVFVPSSKDEEKEKEKEKKTKKMMKVVNLRRIKVGKKNEEESKLISTTSGGGGGGEKKKKGKTMSAAYEAFYGKKNGGGGGGGGGGEKSSYLPYRVGFFTNASGMTRNLHPY